MGSKGEHVFFLTETLSRTPRTVVVVSVSSSHVVERKHQRGESEQAGPLSERVGEPRGGGHVSFLWKARNGRGGERGYKQKGATHKITPCDDTTEDRGQRAEDESEEGKGRGADQTTAETLVGVLTPN